VVVKAPQPPHCTHEGSKSWMWVQCPLQFYHYLYSLLISYTSQTTQQQDILFSAPNQCTVLLQHGNVVVNTLKFVPHHCNFTSSSQVHNWVPDSDSARNLRQYGFNPEDDMLAMPHDSFLSAHVNIIRSWFPNKPDDFYHRKTGSELSSSLSWILLRYSLLIQSTKDKKLTYLCLSQKPSPVKSVKSAIAQGSTVYSTAEYTAFEQPKQTIKYKEVFNSYFKSQSSESTLPFLSQLGKNLQYLIYHGLRFKILDSPASLPEEFSENFSFTLSAFYPAEWNSLKTIMIYNEPRNKDTAKYSSFVYCRTINAIIEETRNFAPLINAVGRDHPRKSDLYCHGNPAAFYIIDSIQNVKSEKMPPDEYGNKSNPNYVPDVTKRAHPMYLAMIPVQNFQAIFMEMDPVPENNEDNLKKVHFNIKFNAYTI
jgi:hypothetical protein